MKKIKITIFTICLIFSLAPFCIGDEVLEMIKSIQEKVDTLEELDLQKERRIAALESTNVMLVTGYSLSDQHILSPIEPK